MHPLTPSTCPSDSEKADSRELDSGYVSGNSSEVSLPELVFTKPHLRFLNKQLQFLEPQGSLSLSIYISICCSMRSLSIYIYISLSTNIS